MLILAVLAIAAAIVAASKPMPTPPGDRAAHRMHPRPGAVAPATRINQGALFTSRVFADRSHGFALADVGGAQYPARTVDGGRTWRTCGPQVHIDAADGAEGVGTAGLDGPRTFYAYGSSVADVSTDAGRTWWETYLGELVVAVVPGPRANTLVAYVQQQVKDQRLTPAVTWQYVSRDGGRHWHYAASSRNSSSSSDSTILPWIPKWA